MKFKIAINIEDIELSILTHLIIPVNFGEILLGLDII
jgi:hypothetical protein